METLGIPCSLGFLELVFNLVLKYLDTLFTPFGYMYYVATGKMYDSFDAFLPLDFITTVDCWASLEILEWLGGLDLCSLYSVVNTLRY